MLSNHGCDKTFIKGIGKKVMAVLSEFKTDILMLSEIIRWQMKVTMFYIYKTKFKWKDKVNCSTCIFCWTEDLLLDWACSTESHWGETLESELSVSGVSHSSQDRFFFFHCYVPWELTGIYSWIIILWQVCDICINSN